MTSDWAAKATAVPYADFGDPQTLNLYGYVRNNPLFRADADGDSDAGTFCNTQCRYGTPVSSAEIQVDIAVLELGSAVATGGATLEAMGAGAALKTALGAIATAGLNRWPVEGNDCSDDAERLQNRGRVDAAAVMKVATR